MQPRRSTRARSPAPASRSRSPAATGKGAPVPAAAQSKPPAAVAAVMALYMAVSVSTTLMNKYAFPKDGDWKFPFPFAVSCFQMVVAVGWLQLFTVVQSFAIKGSQPAASFVRLLGMSDKNALRWSAQDILSSWGAAGAFTGMLSAGNLCLLFVQISFYQAAKSQHILCNLLLGYFVFGNSQPLKIVLCCVGVTTGFVINALAERDVLEKMAQTPDFFAQLLKGCVAGLVSSFFVALYPILLSRSFLKGSDRWQESINVNSMSIIWYLPLVSYEILAGDLLSSPALGNRDFWAFNLLTGSVGFFLNAVAMMHVRYTSPLTHMIVGSLKGAVTTLISVAVLGDQVNAQGVTGLSILIASSFAYSYFRAQLQAKK
eukprot:Tamp_14440.p1 GENE.Tamp_14440~~Tamp_14440.p1  ORF type:complete len:402 (+),score=78.24 Tamp_14440:90-1208(+)